MLPENQERKYEAFLESTTNNQLFDQKVTVMIQLATALAVGCYP